LAAKVALSNFLPITNIRQNDTGNELNNLQNVKINRICILYIIILQNPFSNESTAQVSLGFKGIPTSKNIFL
jgi:hypothetical protein